MIFVKPGSAELDWPITYTLADSETILTSEWSVTPAGAMAVKVGSPDISGFTTSCILTGGALGKVYEVANTITTSQGRKDVRTITFRIGPSEAN